MKRKDYEKALRKLQVELCALQDWVKQQGVRVVVIFEGRDAAGKGGTIKAITERVSPRVFRVVALPAPSDREKSQLYLQRYVQHFPAAGEIVIFDRSWYNRAGVEYVMGFCTEAQHRRFLEVCPEFELFIVDDGILLIKYWLEVGDEAKHLVCGMVDPVLSLKRRHRSPHHELRAELAQALYLSTFGPHGPCARLRCGPSSSRNPRARDMKSGSKATTEQGAILQQGRAPRSGRSAYIRSIQSRGKLVMV